MNLPENFSFIDQQVAGSSYPYAKEHFIALHQEGITDIISLTPSPANPSGRPLTVHHFPSLGPPHPDNLKEILDIIENVTDGGGKVLVHCQYGQERTGVVLAAYLVRRGRDLRTAITEIQNMRPGSLKSYHSIQYLMEQFASDG